jgi:hypothetical protein
MFQKLKSSMGDPSAGKADAFRQGYPWITFDKRRMGRCSLAFRE